MTAPCRACETPTERFARGRVLGHVEVDYGSCPACGLVMAWDPTWLEEAYGDAIATLDVGLLDRCQILASVTASVLRSERLRSGRFLDWAGGYGTLTRLMRDRGYDFVHNDPMAVNLFAEGHDVADPGTERYDLVTAFEVLEHLTDPVGALAPLAASTDRLLTTTQVLPDPAPAPTDWDYYALESGQHITFYTPRSLERLAKRLGFDGVVTSSLVHLFYRGRLSPLTRALVQRPAVSYGLGHLASLADRRHSMLLSDHDAVRSRLAGDPTAS
ncbi:class I SAM-dependent methyltransferase [Nocardioides sp. Soil805]|uniref:class I SAM-dependent methyltransferase n=1 Tax=Nocardioides sp. Soil805 TaxID=1736416 RepID=UPI000702F3C8|nr:class I SAM-dependent methyltransferase [Nocardioides sp. Soil805]KRF36532.1 hypothetical protein ASG94_03535 [Nocardioides sp. Soil805]